jgi:2-methylcitrate dehydratase PrpD
LPRTANDARFHVQYCAALAACGADVIVPQHSVDFDAHLRRPEVRSMIASIEVIPDPGLIHYHQCRVTVSKDGADLHHARSDSPRGSPQNPLVDAEVIAKFQRLAGRRMSADASAAYAARSVQLEHETSCSWLFDELCPM